VLSGRPTRIKGIISVDLPRPRPRNSNAARDLENRIRGLFGENESIEHQES
jgi:ABC-type nitrate/sulfonate/bicarbonate transport system ATPase subunit